MRVLVLSADPLARGGLLSALAAEAGLQPRAWSADDEAADVEVGVWDLGGDPLLPEAVELLEAGLSLVALSPDLARAQLALGAGASAVLLRDGDGERMAAALRAVSLGLTVLDGPFREGLVRVDPEPATRRTEQRGEELTPREREVLGLLAQGLSNRAIGRRLGISENTARFHVNAILGKLGARSRTDAVVRAARAGLVMI